MNKYVKGGLLFASGFACCGVLYTRTILKSKAFHKTFSTMVSDAVASIFVNVKPAPRTSYVSYKSYYDTRRKEKVSEWNDIILETRKEAEKTLNQLEEIIETYGMASVADLCDLVGVSTCYADNKYFWTEIGSATVVRTRNGYQLKLPRPTFMCG